MKTAEALGSVFFVCVLVFISSVYAGCQEGWQQKDTTCFRLLATPENFTHSRTICSNVGGDLAAIKSNLTAGNVYELFAAELTNKTIWSRYRIQLQGQISIVDVTESIITDCSGCNALIGQFNAQNLSRSCIAIDQFSKSGAHWMLADCTDKHQFVCEKTEESSSLKPEDIAAISCAVFLIVSIVIVFIVDMIRNPTYDDDLRQRIVK